MECSLCVEFVFKLECGGDFASSALLVRSTAKKIFYHIKIRVYCIIMMNRILSFSTSSRVAKQKNKKIHAS